MKKECHLIKLHLKQGICNLSRNMSHYFLMFHRSHFCAEPRRRVDGLENQTNEPPSSHPVCFCLVLSGHRAAEEGGEEVGQEVQVDELESGVRPSLLHSLAQPLHSPRPRQGRPLPVHCVDDWSPLNLPPHWPEPELSWLSTFISLWIFHLVFFQGVTVFIFSAIIIMIMITCQTIFFSSYRFPLWCWRNCCTTKAPKTSKEKEALDGRRPQTEHCFLHADFFFSVPAVRPIISTPETKQCELSSSSPECRSRFVFTVNSRRSHDASSVNSAPQLICLRPVLEWRLPPLFFVTSP